MRAVAALSAFAALLVACNPERRCGLRLCDIRQADCQRRTAEAAACLRGVPPVTVPVNLVSREADTKERVMAPAPAADVERWTRKNAGLALLGLADERVSYQDAIKGAAALYGAYYSSDEKAITLIHDRGDSLDGPYAVAMLVHEYAHALQDQLGRLAHDPDDRSLDRTLARAALVEGEATLVEELATIALFDRDHDDFDWDRILRKARDWAVTDALADPLPVERAHRYFSYPFGSYFVHGAEASQRRSGVVGSGLEAAWASRPTVTRQVLAGFAEGLDPPDVSLEANHELAVPGSFDRVFGDRVGAFVLALFLAGAVLDDSDQVWELPAKLASDHLAVFHDPASGRLVVSWRLRFFSSEQAGGATRVLTTARPPEVPFWAARSEGRDVRVVASNHEDSYDLLGLPWREPPAAAPMTSPTPRQTELCPLRKRPLR